MRIPFLIPILFAGLVTKAEASNKNVAPYRQPSRAIQLCENLGTEAVDHLQYAGSASFCRTWDAKLERTLRGLDTCVVIEKLLEGPSHIEFTLKNLMKLKHAYEQCGAAQAEWDAKKKHKDATGDL